MAAPGAKLLQALQYVVIGAAIVHFLPRRFLFFLCAGAVMLVVSLVMGQEKILYHPTVPPDIKTIADNPVGYRSPKEHGIAHEDVWLEASDGVRTHASDYRVVHVLWDPMQACSAQSQARLRARLGSRVYCYKLLWAFELNGSHFRTPKMNRLCSWLAVQDEPEREGPSQRSRPRLCP